MARLSVRASRLSQPISDPTIEGAGKRSRASASAGALFIPARATVLYMQANAGSRSVSSVGACTSENWIIFVAEYRDGNTDYFEIDRATLQKGAEAKGK